MTLVGRHEVLDVPVASPGNRLQGGRDARSAVHWVARHVAPVLIAVIGLAVTASLTGLARANYTTSEQRMAVLEARLVASSLAIGPVDLERRLGKAATEASLTTGSRPLFEGAIATAVGKGGPLANAELFEQTGGVVTFLASAGAVPVVAPSSPATTRIVHAAAHDPTTLVVTRLLRPGVQRFAYAFATVAPGGHPTYVVYGEQVFPASRRVTIPATNPDSNLNVAIYFGKSTSSSALVESSRSVPLPGETATTLVPFGDTVLTLVLSARRSLVGVLGTWVPWIILVVGLVFTIGATVVTEWLVRRRRSAERTATVSRRLLRTEREVSETLQEALLPPELPYVEGLDIAARYRSGSAGFEVGGDWYDVIAAGDAVFFSVGDVAGRGAEAAVVMAQIRHAVNAFGFHGTDPSTVLANVSPIVELHGHGRFATVLCGRIDPSTGEMLLANAGHTPPVVVGGEQASILELPPDPPLGVGTHYRTHARTLATGGTLLAVTDGLVERQGESIDVGLERLRHRAEQRLPLEQLLDAILADLAPDGPHDDIAMLAIRRERPRRAD